MHTQIKREQWWNERRIEWYERASATSDFQSSLSKILAKHLKMESSIAELGCGLGHQTEALKRLGYQISGYDISKTAIAKAKERSGLNCYHVLDTTKELPSADTILSIFFSVLESSNDINRLRNSGIDHLVTVTNKHHGLGRSGEDKRDRTSSLIALLNENGISYTSEELTLGFNQPLLDKEDTLAFINEYYRDKGLDELAPFIKRAEQSDYSYILCNTKHLVLFDIKLSGGEY